MTGKQIVKKVPLRQCVGCGEMKSKKELLRVLKTMEGDILIDLTGKKNGRGAYLCKSLECFSKAEKSKGIARSLKTDISKEIYETLRKEMETLG